ncbi:MAG TPA: amidohydrolase family protein [Pseudolabrys sp.]|jgi:L-fuconolactonase
MTVIDCHHHFWKFGKRVHTFPHGVGNRLDRDYLPEDLQPQLKAAGVDKTILIQVLNQVDETYEFLDMSREVDYVAGVVGWVPLTDPKETARCLEDMKTRGKLLGIRPLIVYEPDPGWLLQSSVRESLKILAKADLVFEAIPATPEQFEAVLTVTKALPDLKVVLNHLGNPPVPEKAWEPWAGNITRAAALPNMSVKLSAGLALVVKWKWSTEEIRRYADYAIDLFKPDRVMAGSNWPVVELGGPYAQVWQGIVDLIAKLSPTERAKILGASAARIYGL